MIAKKPVKDITNNRKFKVKKDMKKIYMLNNSQGVIGLFLGLKSRISPMRPLLTMLALLMVCLFGVNENAWGLSYTGLTVNISGNGQIKLNTSSSQPTTWASTQQTAEQGGHGLFETKVTDYYYIWVNPNAGYHFVNFTGDLTPSWNNAGYYETSFKGATSRVSKTIAANFAANSYTISFAGNGNTSGSMSNQSGFVYGTAKALSDNKFGRAYTVTYDANGGSCGTSSATATYVFAGWKSSDDTSYGNQATISTFSPAPGHNATVTLTAQWTSTSVTLPSATKDGAVLEGWYVGSIAEGNKITTATYTPTANVTLVANWIDKYTPKMEGADQSMMVDAEQENAFTFEHVDGPVAHIKVLSISDVRNGDQVISFEGNKIIAHNAGVAEIYFTQAETETIKKGTSATYTYTVYKYNSTFANVEDKAVKVDADVTSSYTLTYTKPNDAYIGTANIAAGTPVSGENANFYYTLTQNVTTAITAGSPNASLAISYNAASKTVTGKNAGTGTVHFYQPETYKYNAADASFVVTVTKNANKLYANGAETYKPTMQLGKDLAVTLTATNTDYTGSPIQLVEQTAGDNTIAVFDYTQNTHSGTVHSKFKKDVTATWSIHQDENYKYEAANGSFSVDVKTAAENTCYVLNESSGSDTEMDDATWTYNAPGAVLSYKIKRLTSVTYGDVTVYGYDANNNKTTINTHSSTSLPTSYGDPIEVSVDKDIRKIEFNTGSYKNTKYVSDVKVTRKTYINASDLTIDKTSSEAPVYPSGEKGVGTLTIDYSLANGGNLKITNDNPDKFTLSQSEIAVSDCSGSSANITIEYESATAGTDYAHLVIYNDVYRKEVTITGKTVKQTPTVTWSSDAAYFNVEDVLSATNANGLTVTLSSVGNEDYVSCDGNSATMLQATSGTITITAHVTGNGSYEDKDITKDITITNKEKQTISWDQDFSRLKTTDGSKSITLNATTSASGLKVSYALVGDQTGLTLTQDGDTWTLTYTSECKNTTIVASQAGDGTYAPASSLSKTVKVVDPTKVCDESETVVNSTITMKETSNTYNIDIPNKMYVSVSRTKTSWAIYTVGVDFEFWSGRNGTGTKLYTKSYGAGDIDKSISNSEIDLSSYIHAKSVKVVTTSTNGYNIDNITYTHQKYCTISTNSLNFSTHPNTQTAALTFDVSYANYPISLECSNDKFSFTPAEFGDCSEKGTQTVSVSYTAGAEEGNDVGYLYIKDNTGNMLQTCTLNVSISQLTQSITSTNIEQSYLTTDKVTLSAEANSGLTDFTYTASPAGIASFNGAEMTFAQSGTIAITVNQAGNNVYKPTSTTVSNIVVSKATPNIATNPAGTSVVYLQTLENSTLSGGAADIKLHGVDNTPVEGTFAWKTPSQKITDNAGTHSYFVTFTPTDGDMYNTKEFTIPITITRATQAIEMNNGEVKVAVDGIDAGAEDSYIDLDDLIKSQTIDQEEASRTGVVTYEVISENKAKATIGEGNIFSATAIGNYTIRATKAQTDYYSEATAEFVVSVSKRANTMTIAATEYEKFVDDEVTNIRDVQNSDATVQTSSSNANLAYYDIEHNKIVIPNSDNQMFGLSTTVTIKIWQAENERFLASGEKTITLTVKKYVTAISGENYDLLVEGTQEGQYVFENTSAEQPTANSEDDFYYTFENTTFANEALNKEGNNLVTYDPDTKILTAENAGATKIAFYQKETRKYTGATATYWIIVSKHTTNFSCLWDNESTEWTRLMDNNQSATVAISTNHADCPISIEQTYGEGIATLSGTVASATITSTSENGYAIWHLSQAEDYKYSSAEMDLTVAVGVPAPPTCYIVNDATEHEFSTGVQLGVYDTPIEINAPADKIWFSAKRQTGGVNYFVAEYSVDNGTTWREICNPNLSTSYKDFGPYSFPELKSNEFVTHIRFGAKTGATLSKYYKNVKVSRKPYINIQNAGHEKIVSLAMPTNTVKNETTAKFYIDYSTCDGELTIASSNPHFTVSRSTISVDGDNLTETTKEEVTITYSSDAEGNHVGVITVSSSYQVAALSVSGVTNKRIQTIEWKEGFNTTDPITLAVGTVVNDKNIAAEASSGNRVYYASSDASVIEIRNEGKEFAVVGEGTATLTVSAAGNEMWSDVSVSRTVKATEKDIQEIVWAQVFPRFMAINSEVDLDAKVYIRHGNERTYSAARSASLTYTCPLNNGVISVNGNKMTILAYGETTLTANVAGNEDYEAAAPMTVAVNVRQPSQGCQTPFVLEQEGTVSVLTNYSFSSYQYLESNSEILALDKTLMGKPDKLSFQYEGEEYKILGVPVLAGHVTAQQRIDGHWSNVSGSNVEPIKNEWKSIENLQLDERADAIRFYREAGGKGTHNFKDIKITRKQYLTASVEAINVGDIKMGQTKVVNVEFDYSDMKGDLAARAENTANGLTIANNGAIDVECGSFGHYQLPVTIVPTEVNDAWENTVYVKDPITNLEISVNLTANVLPADELYWNDTTAVPGTNANATINEDFIVNDDVTLNKLTVADSVTVTIDGDVTVASLTIEEGATVIVKSGKTLTVGDEEVKDLDTYGNLYVEDDGALILDENTKLEVNNFTIESSIGTSDGSAVSGQVTNAQTMSFANAYIEINMDPSGVMDDSKWYGFTVPFPVDVYEGVSRKEGDTYRQCVYGTHYMIAEYDANQRLNTGKGWKYITGNTLEPGKFYFFTVNGSWNTYRFKSKEATYTQPAAVSLTMNGEGPDANWCAVGNSMLQHVTANFSGSGYVQVYKNGLDAYLPVAISEAAFVVGCPFFIQATEETSLVLNATNSASAYYAPRRAQVHNGVARINLTPVDGGYSDQIYVSGTDKEQEGYVMGHDLSKAGLSKEVSQLWIANYGQKLSVNESAWCGHKAICPLGLYVPENGEYVLTATQPEDNTQIYLTKNGKAIWNLSMSEYTMSLDKGTDSSYGLMLVKAPKITTDTENIGTNGSEHVQKMILDDHVYILRNGEMFDAAGRKVK